MKISIKNQSDDLEISDWFTMAVGITPNATVEIITETETSIRLMIDGLGRVSVPKTMIINSR